MRDKKELKTLAKKIIKLEKECQLGHSTDINMNKMLELMADLSFEELIYVDNYIQNKNLTF